jgi:hypothetical protein
VRHAFACVALIALLGATIDGRQAMTPVERQRLVAHVEMTGAWFVDEISDLSAAQLAFKPTSDAWSIAEVIDHILVVGPIYWNDLQSALKTAPAKRDTRNSDAEILWYGVDRMFREKAIPSEVPAGRFRDLRSAITEYGKNHDRLLQYLKTTNDALRSHYVERQGSDAYQWALLISTHEQRHILQIREIKAAKNFPRK